MKSDGIEAPVAPVLESRHRSQDRARITAVAIVAVVLVAAGIGLAGKGPAGPPAGSPSALGTNASREPSSSAEPAAAESPSEDVGRDCVPVRVGDTPEIGLSAWPGAQLAQPGLSRPSEPDAFRTATLDWPTIPVAQGLGTEKVGSAIEIRADQDACIGYVVADYIPAEGPVPTGFPIAFRSFSVAPPRSIVPLGPLPGGDWIIRVEARFVAVDPAEDNPVTERFFRFTNSDTARPLPTPQEGPAAPCAPAPADGLPPRLLLSGAGPDPLPGALDATEMPVATVQLGDRVELRVSGDWCAIGWIIGGTQPDQNNQFDFDRADNPGNDPFLFAQNRFLLHDLPTGDIELTATVRFSIDTVVTSRWRLDVHGLAVPSAHVVTPNGNVTASDTGCNAYWNFANASSGYQYCPSDPLPSSIPSITVAPGTPIRIEVPGWTIVGWSSNCGRADEANSPDFPFMVVDGCDLGSNYGGNATTPIQPIFLPRSSGPLVRIWLSAVRGDETVSWPVYVTVTTSS